MHEPKIEVNTEVKVMVNGKPIDEVLRMACELAHDVLEELSIYRQRNDLDPLFFQCEGECCGFLDFMGD